MRVQKNHKICAVCGRRFASPPSDKTVTCSRECSSIHRSRTHKGKRNQWSDESRAKLRAAGQTANLKLGTPAAKMSPISGAVETNRNAKHWVLKSPENMLYEFDNLALFIRQHPEFFSNPKSAHTALISAASCVKESTTPHSRRGRAVTQYKGWTVVSRSEKERERRFPI